jgi:hypothetical protein
MCESVGITTAFTRCMQLEADRETRRNFVNWQLLVLRAGDTPRPTCFAFGARFNLDGCVNCQSDTNRHAENPTLTHEMPLHKVTAGVWSAMSATWIMSPPPPPDHKFKPKLYTVLEPFFGRPFDYNQTYDLCHTTNSGTC